jgi:hypothetical protein
VFLSHAGAQKRIVVDYLHSSFKDSGISVFLDQHALESGRTREDVRNAVDGASVGEFHVAIAAAAYLPRTSRDMGYTLTHEASTYDCT